MHDVTWLLQIQPAIGTVVEVLPTSRRAWVPATLQSIDRITGKVVVALVGTDSSSGLVTADWNSCREVFIEPAAPRVNVTKTRGVSGNDIAARELGVHSKFGEGVSLVPAQGSDGGMLVRHCNLLVRCPAELATGDVTLAAAESLLANYMSRANIRAEVCQSGVWFLRHCLLVALCVKTNSIIFLPVSCLVFCS